MNCFACGNTNFIKGELINESFGGRILFKPEESAESALSLKAIFGGGTKKVFAFGCANCGTLQFGVNINPADRKRFSKSETQPPSVTESLDREND